MPSVDNLQQNPNQSHLKCQPPSHVPTSFSWSQWGNHVCIAGSFDPPTPVWEPIEMSKNENNTFNVTLNLIPKKKYFYKFVIDCQWVLDPTIPSYSDEHGNYNHVIEVELPPPPPLLPPEEEKLTVEDQHHDEEQEIEKLKPEVHQKESHQNVEEQVEVDIQKEHHQHEEIQEQLQLEKEQVPSGVQTEVGTNDQKGDDDQVTAMTDDQKVQHLHDDDQIEKADVESTEITEFENQEKSEQIVEEVRAESIVTVEITESSTPEIEPISSVSIVNETMIESNKEDLSAETVANNEPIIISDIVINEKTQKESQYTSSTSHDDSMNLVTATVEKEINIIGEVTSEQTKEEMASSNQVTQETEISDVNVEELSGLSNEVEVHEDIIEQSAVVEDDSINVSKVTEFIEEKSSIDEKHEQDITSKDILTPSSSKISDTTTHVDPELEFETHSTDTIMPSTDVNYEETYEPELDPINENEDDNYDEDVDYDDYNYDDDNYYNEDESGKGVNKDENNNDEYLNYEDISKSEIYPEGVSPEDIKEVILNHTWARDDSIDETIPNTWLEPYESTAYVWSENTQAEWLIYDKELHQEQVTNTWTSSEENTETHKSEHVIEEPVSSNEEINIIEDTVTKQAGIPPSTSVNENPESTVIKEIPAQSTIYNNESNVEQVREIIDKENVEEKAKEYDNMAGEKVVTKENIISTSEVKVVVAEPSSVKYEKPESSATADEKVSSMSTTVIAPPNDQDMINADVLKAIEKLKLIEKQENFDISARTISQRKISKSPNVSSPGESTRNADVYTATNTSREIMSPTKETVSKKSKSKKPPIEITSREVLQRDPQFVIQHDNLDKLDFSIIYLVTSVATTFTLGIISMLYKSFFGSRNK